MNGLGIAAIALTAVALVVAAAGRATCRRRLQRSIWGFKVPAHESPSIVVETLHGHQTDLYRRPTVGLGAIAAVTHLAAALDATRSGWWRRAARSLRYPVVVRPSSDDEAYTCVTSADTVVVGGPKSNEITGIVLDAYGWRPPYPEPDEDDQGDHTDWRRRQEAWQRRRQAREAAFEQLAAELVGLTRGQRSGAGRADGLGVATLGNHVFWFGERYVGDVGLLDVAPCDDTYRGQDYGVVLRLPSPYDQGRRVVVVFGSQTFGVEAAARWLVGLRLRSTDRELRSTMARNPNVAVLVRADVEHGLVGAPELVDLVVLPVDLGYRAR